MLKMHFTHTSSAWKCMQRSSILLSSLSSSAYASIHSSRRPPQAAAAAISHFQASLLFKHAVLCLLFIVWVGQLVNRTSHPQMNVLFQINATDKPVTPVASGPVPPSSAGVFGLYSRNVQEHRQEPKNLFITCLVCVLVLKPTFTPSGCRLTESGVVGLKSG